MEKSTKAEARREYHRNYLKNNPRVYSAEEREYRRQYMEEYRKKNPNKVKDWASKYYKDRSRYLHYARKNNLKKKYGITLEEYARMVGEQNGLCAICKQPPQRYRLAVDHCHRTGRVRKLLCMGCNGKLSVFEDMDWEEKARAYLKEFVE